MAVASGVAAATFVIAFAVAGLWRRSRLPARRPVATDAPVPAPPASAFADRIAALAAPHDGLSGFHLLPDARDSFAARVLLARHAQRSLDLQYYIWSGDRTGTMLLGEMLDAARRGVKVRLLLDDHGTGGLDRSLSALAAEPNIEIRLFNPFIWRGVKLAGFLFDFARLNRRMHNKCFVADDAVVILGGRNIGDDYFGASDGALLADMDVAAVGPIVGAIGASFDDYWQSPLALPVDQLIRPSPAPVLGILRARARRLASDPATRDYATAVGRLPIVRQLQDGSLPLDWASARLVTDDPRKSEGTAGRHDLLATRLRAVIGKPQRDLRLVSAYFVPGKRLVEAFVALARDGVDVSILTNGAQAADVGPVFSYYAKYRRALVDGGVRLFELRRAERYAERPKVTLRKSIASLGKSKGSSSSSGSGSASSLHAKAFTVDGQRLFVGSFNVDPRSVHLNTELGVVIDSPGLARAVNALFDRSTPAGAYEVRVGASGGLVWIDRASDPEQILTAEPGMTGPSRAANRLVAHLPLEWLM